MHVTKWLYSHRVAQFKACWPWAGIWSEKINKESLLRAGWTDENEKKKKKSQQSRESKYLLQGRPAHP
jgi:hypothetical protein